MRFVLVISLVGALALALAGPGSASPQSGVHLALYGPFFPSGAGTTYTCDAGAKVPPGPNDTFGFATLRGRRDRVFGEVELRGAAPNSFYGFIVEQNPGDCGTTTLSGDILTDEHGDGGATFSVPRIPTATRFWIGMGTSFSGPFIFTRAISLS
jgi:hypothetical protein